MQSGKYHSPGNRQTQTCPSDCKTEKRDSSLFSSKENFMDGLIAQVATYHGTRLEFTELLRAIHSFTNVCRSSLHAQVLDFIHLLP
ncbi:unnamed protein product, partial [Staurois parvus]